MSETFELQLTSFGEKQNIKKLQELVNNISTRELIAIISEKLGRNDCVNFWTHLLQGFDLENIDAREKRFACVKAFLDSLLKIELNYKQTFDMISRLCQDLPTFSNTELIVIMEYCIDNFRAGDPKCIGWKDLFPETLNVLGAQQLLDVNGVSMSGGDFRDLTLNNLCTMRWPRSVLTPLANMFREFYLSNTEKTIIISKFANEMMALPPMDLPALAYQIFGMCDTANQIVVPILAFEKYFHRYYYRNLFSDVSNNSIDFDTIDDVYLDKELREAEQTILHHISNGTHIKINETHLCTIFRNFNNMPDIILTPFVLSVIISMTPSNRNPESSSLSTSILLPLIRSVINHNEEERNFANYSLWCRDTLQRKQVDIEKVFYVLIDQNKEGKDAVTPGLVDLAFLLLKTHNNTVLHTIATSFLRQFIHKRFLFGPGIIKRIVKWMLAEKEQYQYSECLTMLSVADTFTIAECVETIKEVIDYFQWLSGDDSLRMMSFILPLIKISVVVRDALIESLRKAMNSSQISTRRMAVYGFCMILKQLNNSNSYRSLSSSFCSSFCTQNNISGFSLITQSSYSSSRNPQRNFDMLTLEIIGILRRCLSQSVDVKLTLYENLQRAVEINTKLVPHVLQFIDWHFRSYFNTTISDDLDQEPLIIGIFYELLLNAVDEKHMVVNIKENLGYLIQFVSHCLEINLRIDGSYDTCGMKRILHTVIERIVSKELQFEDTAGPGTRLKCALIHQQLNIIEGLISFAILSSTQSNSIIKNILPLFKQHSKLDKGLKDLEKKSQKRFKNANDDDNAHINVLAGKRIGTPARNIWDFAVIEKLLRVLHEDNVTFASSEHTSELRSHVELVQFVLEVAIFKVEAIRMEHDYKQLKHSKRVLKYLTDITKVVYERCIKRLPTIWRDFDMRTAVYACLCFMQCLKTANNTYKKSFQDPFVKGFDLYVIHENQKEAAYVLQDIIDAFMVEDASAQNDDEKLFNVPLANLIPRYLLESLGILYDNVNFDNRITIDSYTWLFHFCQTYEVTNDSLHLVHKLLFEQRQKTHSGAFFNTIAQLLGKVLGRVFEEEGDTNDGISSETQLDFQLKSITKNSAVSCLRYLYNTLHKQIEEVDYFINKSNNQSFKCEIVGENDRAFQKASLHALQRAICTQLIHVSKTLLELTNVCIPLGTSMDNLMSLLILLYSTLKNLAKHLRTCANTNISIKSTKFDLLLLVVGKPLPSNVYGLIKYIEENIIEDEGNKKISPEAEKAKVLRQTKHIPKIILSIENFNKNVILLDKKSKHGLLTKLLHFGTVRDFRIKTTELKAAIERSYSYSKDIKEVKSNLGDDEITEDRNDSEMQVGEDNDDESGQDQGDDDQEVDKISSPKRNTRNQTRASKRKNKTTSDSNVCPSNTKRRNKETVAAAEEDINISLETTPTPEILQSTENAPPLESQLLKNLAKINTRSKRAGRSAKK